MKVLDAGLLHGDCLTVNGRTVAENLADVSVELEGQDVLYPLSAPVKPTAPISVIKGNLAPEGAVLKSSGGTVRRHTGPARVFDEEESALRAILDGSIVAGAGLIADVALITDGRFSGGSHGIVVGHVAPEAQAGGPIAAVQEGDEITLDLDAKTIDVALTDQEIEARLREIKPAERPIPYQRGVLAKYARLVSSASLGAITH